MTAFAPTTGDPKAFDVSVAATGEHFEVRVTVLNGRRGRVMGRTLVARNVTAARDAQRALERYNDTLREQVETIEALRRDLAEQATRDALTGLHNRRHLMGYLAGAADSPLTVAMLDVDHFKRVNDEWGHPAGDEVLRRIAATLSLGLGAMKCWRGTAARNSLSCSLVRRFLMGWPGSTRCVARWPPLRSRSATAPC